VAPPPRAAADSIDEADERFMAHWRRGHPEDVEYMHAFWEQKKAERRAVSAEKRRRKAAILEEYAKEVELTLYHDSNQWLDVISTTASEDTDSDVEYND
jgi:hypothetical protein